MDLIIFDCDGTLVESELLGYVALEAEFLAHGIVESADSLTKRYRGAKLADVLSEISGIHNVRLDEDFVKRYRKRVKQLFSTNLCPVPGIKELLPTLQLPFCVASSGPLEKIRHSLAVTGLLPYFENRIFSSYEIQSWKPEPQLFLHAARTMGVQPENCLVVEDSSIGIEAAHRAGMRSVLYDPSGIHAEAGASLVLTHMMQLWSLLEKGPANS